MPFGYRGTIDFVGYPVAPGTRTRHGRSWGAGRHYVIQAAMELAAQQPDPREQARRRVIRTGRIAFLQSVFRQWEQEEIERVRRVWQATTTILAEI